MKERAKDDNPGVPHRENVDVHLDIAPNDGFQLYKRRRVNDDDGCYNIESGWYTQEKRPSSTLDIKFIACLKCIIVKIN